MVRTTARSIVTPGALRRGTSAVAAIALSGVLALGACRRADRGGLRVPDDRQGALTATDFRLQDGSVADDYSIELVAGQTVSLTVRGGRLANDATRRLDVYAILYLDGDEVAHDDDGAGDLDSRIVHTATRAGTYTLRVTTYGPGLQVGPYSLTVRSGGSNNTP